jgi:hypothetical protein
MRALPKSSALWLEVAPTSIRYHQRQGMRAHHPCLNRNRREDARDEFHLAAATQNPRKLATLIPEPAPTPATVPADPCRRNYFKPDLFDASAKIRTPTHFALT